MIVVSTLLTDLGVTAKYVSLAEEDNENATEYIDDEDVSWKAQRAAAKCLTTLTVLDLKCSRSCMRKIIYKVFDTTRSRTQIAWLHC